MLTELGANSFGAVCWLGDRDEQFANQFIGMHESAWSRFKEKMRVDVWTREGSCFESRIKVAVVLFPYVEATRASGLKSDNLSSVIQREISLLLSQTGPGAEFEKQSTTFHLQTGANFRVYKRRPPMSSPSTQ